MTSSNPSKQSRIKFLRADMVALGAKIRAQLSKCAALRQALQEAENVYFALHEDRKRCLADINLLHCKQVSLPTEIIIQICSYASPSDFNSIVDVWGDVAHKAIPRTFKFYELLKEETKELLPKCSFVRISDFVKDEMDLGYILPALKQSASLELWKELDLHVSFGKLSHAGVIKIVRACRAYLSSVLTLKVTGSSFNSTGEGHRCPSGGCLQDVFAPACTKLTLPLSFLPCFRNVNAGRILHLEINLDGYFSSNFVSYFQNFDVRNLQTLSLRWISGYPFPSQFCDSDPSTRLNAPNLRKVATRTDGTFSPGTDFFALLYCIDCKNLETLEISDDFNRRVHQKNQFLGAIGALYSSLTHLSLRLRMQPSQSDVNFRFVSGVLGDLKVQGASGNIIPLPRLSRLAVPHPWKNFDQLETGLTELLENRERAGAPIHTIELVIDDDLSLSPVQQLQIDRLGLFIKRLLITRRTTDHRYRRGYGY